MNAMFLLLSVHLSFTFFEFRSVGVPEQPSSLVIVVQKMEDACKSAKEREVTQVVLPAEDKAKNEQHFQESQRKIKKKSPMKPQKTSPKSRMPLVLGIGFALLVCAAVVIFIKKKGHSSESDTNQKSDEKNAPSKGKRTNQTIPSNSVLPTVHTASNSVDLIQPPTKPIENWAWFKSTYQPSSESLAYPLYRCIKLNESLAIELDFDASIDAKKAYYFKKEMRQSIAHRFLTWAKNQDVRDGLLIQADDHTRYWFMGDTHGHFSAVVKAFLYIDSEAKKNPEQKQCIIFLGDSIDRGAHCLESLSYIMERMMQEDSQYRYIYIKGNHDEGLSVDAENKFKSSVSPAETVERLNKELAEDPEDAHLMAQCIMELVRISPCMGEIVGLDAQHPDYSILFMHAGVPHVDLQECLYDTLPAATGVSMQDFMSIVPDAVSENGARSLKSRCAEDFTWVRLVPSLPYKKPQRATRGCEIGTHDVGQYLQLHKRLTGRKVSFILRGHDHELAGYSLYSYDKNYNNTSKKMVQRDCGVLTVNTMEPEAYSSSGLFKSRQIALVSWCKNDDLSCFVIPTKLQNDGLN